MTTPSKGTAGTPAPSALSKGEEVAPSYAMHPWTAMKTSRPDELPQHLNRFCEYCTKVVPKDHHRADWLRCRNCKEYHYCSDDCQKADWPIHKKECCKQLHFKQICVGMKSLLMAGKLEEYNEHGGTPTVFDQSRSIVDGLQPYGAGYKDSSPYRYSIFYLKNCPNPPTPTLANDSVRNVRIGTIHPRLMYVLRQLSWPNMPAEFRSFSYARAVEWGEEHYQAGLTGIMVDHPNSSLFPDVHNKFLNWLENVVQTPTTIKRLEIVIYFSPPLK